MRTKKAYYFPVMLFAYVILAGGVLSTFADYYDRIEYSSPRNMGIIIGNTALVLLGLATWAIAKCLKSLEERLDKIESQ